jgi:hypothetical protein
MNAEKIPEAYLEWLSARSRGNQFRFLEFEMQLRSSQNSIRDLAIFIRLIKFGRGLSLSSNHTRNTIKNLGE